MPHAPRGPRQCKLHRPTFSKHPWPLPLHPWRPPQPNAWHAAPPRWQLGWRVLLAGHLGRGAPELANKFAQGERNAQEISANLLAEGNDFFSNKTRRVSGANGRGKVGSGSTSALCNSLLHFQAGAGKWREVAGKKRSPLKRDPSSSEAVLRKRVPGNMFQLMLSHVGKRSVSSGHCRLRPGRSLLALSLWSAGLRSRNGSRSPRKRNGHIPARRGVKVQTPAP